MNFGRVITAMVTPFDEDLKVDFKALEKLIEHLISTGTDTLLVTGTPANRRHFPMRKSWSCSGLRKQLPAIGQRSWQGLGPTPPSTA